MFVEILCTRVLIGKAICLLAQRGSCTSILLHSLLISGVAGEWVLLGCAVFPAGRGMLLEVVFLIIELGF